MRPSSALLASISIDSREAEGRAKVKEMKRERIRYVAVRQRLKSHT
jgi:hypothetical protein